MRGVKISVPVEKAQDFRDLIFQEGVDSITTYEVEHLKADNQRARKVHIEVETNTPLAKKLCDAIFEAPFFDQNDCFVSTRQRRSIVSSKPLRQLTWPWREPGVDICQELWQFSHLTASLVFRTVIAGGLLAYGLIHQQLLFIISGILFLPTLPIVLAIGFGSWLRQWELARTAITTFTVNIVLLVICGVLVGSLAHGPVKFDDFESLPVSILVSIGVGVASAIASSDDVGRRELIGLAATAQIAIIPVWIGACLVLGTPVASSEGELKLRVVNFFINIALLVVSSTATYVVSGAIHPSLRQLKS